MTNLRELENFGKVDAEEDPYLSECFETHEAFVSAQNHSRFLILGRKGSGKSAIYRKLSELQSHDVFVQGYEFADYPWYYHEQLASAGVPVAQRYAASWQYFMLLMAARVIINQDNSQPWNPDAREGIQKMSEFVKNVYGTSTPEPVQVFTSDKMNRLKVSAGLHGYGVGLEGSRTAEETGKPIPFSDINRYLTETLVKCLNPDHRYYLCFDQLDRGFEQSDEYKDRLIGVLVAARDLNLAVKKAGKKFAVLVFLRDDIYQALSFEDKNKLTENYSIAIGWSDSEESLGTKTLRQLMSKRFAKLLGIPERDAWSSVFDESVVMTGNQAKYQHIIDRTFLRPRDAIKFCNEVLAAYKRRGGTSLFDNRDVDAARPGYSQYLLNELDDEILKHVPNYKQYLALISAVGTAVFPREEFVRVYEQRRSAFKESETVNQILKSLFEFSVIGSYSPGRGSGGEYVWKYTNPRAQFDEAASFYRVHYGFIEGLDLKKFSRRRKVKVEALERGER